MYLLFRNGNMGEVEISFRDQLKYQDVCKCYRHKSRVKFLEEELATVRYKVIC